MNGVSFWQAPSMVTSTESPDIVLSHFLALGPTRCVGPNVSEQFHMSLDSHVQQLAVVVDKYRKLMLASKAKSHCLRTAWDSKWAAKQ